MTCFSDLYPGGQW